MTAGADYGRPVIAVLGSGRVSHELLAAPLGHWIARQGYHLLTGGGGGVMTSVSRAFVETSPREGMSIGVLPSREGDPRSQPPSGYPNRWIEIAIHTHLPCRGADGMALQSRNHINVLSAAVVIGLPGGAGTASELRLARKYNRPCVVLDGDGSQWPPLPVDILHVATVDDATAFVRQQIGQSSG